jgi:hypothetical protein
MKENNLLLFLKGSETDTARILIVYENPSHDANSIVVFLASKLEVPTLNIICSFLHAHDCKNG